MGSPICGCGLSFGSVVLTRTLDGYPVQAGINPGCGGYARLMVPGATRYLPENRSLPALRRAASGCRGCTLYENASQSVFGSGRSDAPLMLVGEQPGDREDREGRPFVGPAGRLLARSLREAGIEAELTYQTNAVKHFKFTQRQSSRRIHQKPGRTEVVACRPWLIAEIEAVHPRVIVCLGATAAQSLLGATFRISEHRGVPLALPDGLGVRSPPPLLLVTLHPSAVLRDRTGRRAESYRSLVDDLRLALSVCAKTV